MKTSVTIETLEKEVQEVRDDFPRWTADNAFVHWFINAFLISDSTKAASTITGVTHDKGVDAVYIDDDLGKVFVVQGKFHTTAYAPVESRSSILEFADHARRLWLGGGILSDT
jgi:hypothetical protein